MNQSFECFLDVPYRKDDYDEEQLFPIDLPQAYRPPKRVQVQLNVIEDEAIDEQLLLKTSKLHQARRNKKLLQFELLQCKIMKKDRLAKSQQLQQQIQEMLAQKSSIQAQGKEHKDDCLRLQRQIDNQKTKNAQLKDKVSQTNHQIIRNKHQLSNTTDEFNTKMKSTMKKPVKEHGYISVEKIRLEGENSSKKEMVQEIKIMIGQLKDKISGKERINQELQEEYQSLLKELQKAGQKQKKIDKIIHQSNEQAASQRIPTTFRGSSLLDETERLHIDQENNMNYMNAPVQSHSKSLESLKAKLKVKVSKVVNSQHLKDKKKDVDRKCLKKWVQKGAKTKKLH